MEELLRQISLFRQVPPDKLALLTSSARLRRYAKGQIIFHQGDAPSALYCIRRGQVRVFISTEEGGEATLAVLGEGEQFGELGVLDGFPRSASVQAVQDTEAVILERSHVLKFLGEEQGAALAVCMSLASRLRSTDERLSDVLFLPLASRLARLVFSLASQSQGSEVRMSQEALARMVGATRQRVNQTLGEWEMEGWIERSRGRVRVRDLASLRRMF